MLPLVEGILQERYMRVLELPSVDELLEAESTEPFVFDKAFESDPLQRYGVAAAESAKIKTVAVVAGYHGQTCNATLGSLRLHDDRDSPEVHLITP